MLLIFQWLTEHTNQLVAASNFTISALMALLCSILIFYIVNLWNRISLDLKILMFGFILEAAGWAIHRFYWGIWRVYRLLENEVMDKWFVDHAWLAIIPQFLVISGLVLIIGPVVSFLFETFKKNVNYHHYVLAIGSAFSLFWFFYWQLEIVYKKNNPPEVKKIEKVIKVPVNRLMSTPPNYIIDKPEKTVE